MKVRSMLSLSPVRFAADAMVGFAMFSVTTIALLGPSAAASIVTGDDSAILASGVLAASRTVSMAGDGLNDPRTILIALAVVFSALFALNVAFIRHLQKAHVSVPVMAERPSDPNDHD